MTGRVTNAQTSPTWCGLRMSLSAGGGKAPVEVELEARADQCRDHTLLTWRQAHPTDNWKSMLGAKLMKDCEQTEVAHILGMWALKLNCGLRVDTASAQPSDRAA